MNTDSSTCAGLGRRTEGAENRRIRQLALTLIIRGRNLLVQCDAGASEGERFEEALFGVLAAPERETLRRLLIGVIAADRSAQATVWLRRSAAKRSGMRGAPRPG